MKDLDDDDKDRPIKMREMKNVTLPKGEVRGESSDFRLEFFISLIEGKTRTPLNLTDVSAPTMSHCGHYPWSFRRIPVCLCSLDDFDVNKECLSSLSLPANLELR